MPCVWFFDVLTVDRAARRVVRSFPEPYSYRRLLMTTSQREARRQLEQFLTALFRPNELIEFRFIESWVSRGKKKSRVVRAAEWLHPHDFLSQHTRLTVFARQSRANIYFGVCPRAREGDAHDELIKTIRCVWCDVDQVSAKEAEGRWKDAGIPRPSIVVSSGSGIHGYWLLEHDLQTPEERLQFAAMLPYFYRSFGGDHVQNLSRVLRPPGTMNYKDARNGRPPLPCTLCACDATLRYPLQTFSPWIDQAEGELRRQMSSRRSEAHNRPSLHDVISRHIDAAALVGQLDQPSRDRSRRDFAIVCDLLRLGLVREEIWELVCGKSKFASNGRPYFDLTIANAENRIFLDDSAPSRPQVPP